jgi:hypothetical protein
VIVPEGHGLLDVRKELELVLDVIRREYGAARELADVLRPVDDPQVPVLVEEPGVPGVKISFRVDRFRGGIGPAVIFLEQHGTADQHLAVTRDPDFGAGSGLPDAVEPDLAVGLQADVGARFRRTIELLQVDADRAVEAEEVGPDRRAGGVGNADPAHAEHVAQRCIDEEVAQPVENPVGE